MKKKKTFSERLYEVTMDLLSSRETKEITSALDKQENYFAPSKYNFKRFQGKAIDHLDPIEEFFNVDLLGGAMSALAREVDSAEQDEVLSQYDRKIIRNVISSAREHASSHRGRSAVEKVKRVASKKNG